MTDWIKENIDPPGMEKKNRFALFKTIGDIMSLVKTDAIKAFNAHFPYLADDKKLEEHALALSIPRLMHDKPDEFRNRVATASFFLMKAGERGFIMGLLRERFGERFQVIEKFLQLQTKVAELSDEEKKWTLALLDSLIDPNVSLELSEWLLLIDQLKSIQDLVGAASYMVKHLTIDSIGGDIFYDGTHCYDGSQSYGPRVHDELKLNIKHHYYLYDGEHKYDGSIFYGRQYDPND